MNVFKDDESKKPIPYDQLNGNHLGHIRAMEGRAQTGIVPVGEPRTTPIRWFRA